MNDDLPGLARHAAAPPVGIVHLGLGAFFRAHGAMVIQAAVKAAGGSWGIVGVSLRSPAIRDALRLQGFSYTSVELDGQRETPRQIDALSDVIFAPENPEALLAQMADPAIKIVSMTVTEKGYCHVPGTGQLNPQHPEVQADIRNPHPQTAIGYVVRALDRRRKSGLRPFTVLSCDNLPDNGQVARAVTLGLAQAIDPDLARWIATEGCFPSTMVDRIVPATTSADIKALAARTGTLDLAPVFHEPFLQWVIEDRFVDNERPAFDQVAGVSLTADVAPFERMKIRMLNGTHSTLAYLGYLAGHSTIADTMQDPVFQKLVRRIWTTEIIPTLDPPPGTDLTRYASDLFERYCNRDIQHRTWQIAMDGSQKLPQRLLATIADNLDAGQSCEGLMLGVAGWMRYVGGVDETGAPIDVKDPLATTLRTLSDQADHPKDKAANLLSVQEIFGGSPLTPLGQDGIVAAYERLVSLGAAKAVARYVS